MNKVWGISVSILLICCLLPVAAQLNRPHCTTREQTENIKCSRTDTALTGDLFPCQPYIID